MALRRVDSNTPSKIPNPFLGFFVGRAGISVGEPVIMCRNPRWLDPVIVLDLRQGENPRHSETLIQSRAAILSQVPATDIVRIDLDMN